MNFGDLTQVITLPSHLSNAFESRSRFRKNAWRLKSGLLPCQLKLCPSPFLNIFWLILRCCSFPICNKRLRHSCGRYSPAVLSDTCAHRFLTVCQSELLRLRAALHEVSTVFICNLFLSIVCRRHFRFPVRSSCFNSLQRLAAAAAAHDALQREALEGGTSPRVAKSKKKSAPSK